MHGFPDKSLLPKKFNRIAKDFNNNAFIHKDIREKLISRIHDINITPNIILDAGCGSGDAAFMLHRDFPTATIFGVDFSTSMIQHAKKSNKSSAIKFSLGDIESSKLNKSPDLIYSNLAFPWCNPMILLKHWHHMLNKSGTLLFTTFGPNNLIELREAWQSIDDDIHIHPAFSAEDLTRLMVDSNFSDVVIDIERLYIEYRSLQQLWLDIKNTASSNCIVGRPKGLTSTKKWDNFTNILTEKGTPIKITIEIIYATGKKLEGKRPSLPKDIIIPVESINTRNM